MRGLVLPVGLCAVFLLAACESKVPQPYFLVAPSELAPGISSSRVRWDSAAEWREWVENPWTEGPFTIRSEGGIEFVHIDLRQGVSSRLNGPSFDPVFAGLRGVRVRVRYVPEPAAPLATMHRVFAYAAPAGARDPAGAAVRGYIVTPAPTPDVWQVLDLGPDSAPYFPAVVDARWIYLALGRTGDVGADIDWVELLR
jgi:hypothetical protein